MMLRSILRPRLFIPPVLTLALLACPHKKVVDTTSKVLEFEVIDAKFSQALSRIVLISSDPTNALHLYDPVGKKDQAVPLPGQPVALTLDGAGTSAAVVLRLQRVSR